MKQVKMLCLLCLCLLMVSCSWWNRDEEYNPFEGQSAEQLYTEASQGMKKGEYSYAIKRYEALETMYPFNDYAEQAEMDLIYAYYKQGNYASTAATAERFIHLYPRAKNVDYVYYMKAMANFQQTRGTLANMLPIDESWRAPGTQSQAYTDFATLIQQFPESRYKANALQRMIYLRNMFAQHEYHVANYYFTRRMYVAANERAGYLIKTYPQAPSAKNALVLVYKANMAMGLTKAAEEAAIVYQNTYNRPIN